MLWAFLMRLNPSCVPDIPMVLPENCTYCGPSPPRLTSPTPVLWNGLNVVSPIGPNCTCRKYARDRPVPWSCLSCQVLKQAKPSVKWWSCWYCAMSLLLSSLKHFSIDCFLGMVGDPAVLRQFCSLLLFLSAAWRGDQVCQSMLIFVLAVHTHCCISLSLSLSLSSPSYHYRLLLFSISGCPFEFFHVTFSSHSLSIIIKF